MKVKLSTYALSCACADVVGETSTVVWVTHEDGGLDGSESVTSESCTSTSAKGVVHNLTTLHVC
jgi:hypothetical protein